MRAIRQQLVDLQLPEDSLIHFYASRFIIFTDHLTDLLVLLHAGKAIRHGSTTKLIVCCHAVFHSHTTATCYLTLQLLN
jgi:ABC-type antimicrobial peptide transport system ATPase subunit